jgi:DNA-binding transcriptional LysR family regulator
MDKLDAMTVFTAIAAAGSLSGASRQLAMPLASVSRKLADLEAHLKIRLITRSTRKLVLTDAGHDYLQACRHILEQVDEAERAATGAYAAAKGELVIAAPIVLGRLHLVPVVASFLALFPEVDVRLLLGDRNLNLLEAQVDLALRIGELPDSSLVATPLGHITRVVCASPAYLAQHGTPTRPSDLARHSCISFEALTAPQAWTFPVAGTVRLRSRLTVNTADAAIAAALAGAGLTRVLSYQVADALQQGLLVRVLSQDEPPAAPVSLLRPGQGRLPMKTRAFIDHAVPLLTARLG